jgi:hypothetical protein
MDAGQLALDAAMQAVDENADEKWKKAAGFAVVQVALRKTTFTPDDVWEVLDTLDVGTSERRALGPVMDRAAKDGIITSTGTYIKSRRASRHKGPVTVWKSRIFREDQ